MASCTRSARALRLSRPVSGSIRARRVSSWCSARLSLMSSNWLMPYSALPVPSRTTEVCSDTQTGWPSACT
jgi:hypothetical protein